MAEGDKQLDQEQLSAVLLLACDPQAQLWLCRFAKPNAIIRPLRNGFSQLLAGLSN